MRYAKAVITMVLLVQSLLWEKSIMLKWALIFAVIAIIAGLFGFTGIAAGAAAIAKFL
jgi:Protein of unknown function (DUF1328)